MMLPLVLLLLPLSAPPVLSADMLSFDVAVDPRSSICSGGGSKAQRTVGREI